MYQDNNVKHPAYFGLLPFFAFGCIFQGFVVGIILLFQLWEVDVFSAIVLAIASIFSGFIFAAFIHAFSALVSSNLKMCALLTPISKTYEETIAANINAAKPQRKSENNLPEGAAAEDLASLGFRVQSVGENQWEVISKLGTQIMSSDQLVVFAKHKFS